MVDQDRECLLKIVKKTMLENDLISCEDEICLTPHHRFNISEMVYSHYIISCKDSNQFYFLKMLKPDDNALFCLPYLKGFCKESGSNLYPQIVALPFEFKNSQYYITTFLTGQTLDDVADNLTTQEWEYVSKELLNRITELADVHSFYYSYKGHFIYDNYPYHLIQKIKARLYHPVFSGYSKEKIVAACSRCGHILNRCQFSIPVMIHMDIKPANIIYNPNHAGITLIDFEFARFGDYDYGWTQLLLSGINLFHAEYKKNVIPYLASKYLSLKEACEIPKFQCYIFYQTACNLIYYYEHHVSCPQEMVFLFEKMLDTLSEGNKNDKIFYNNPLS